MPLYLPTISKFPALHHPVIFFTNPRGTQVAQPIRDRMSPYLVEHNASHGSTYKTILRKCVFGCTINSYPSCNETGFGICPGLHINPQL